jgi:hypothetical protein
MFDQLAKKAHELIIELNFRKAVRLAMVEFPFITEDTAEKIVIAGWVLCFDGEPPTVPERIKAKHHDYIEGRKRGPTPEELNYLKKHVFNGVLPDTWSEIEPELIKLRLGISSAPTSKELRLEEPNDLLTTRAI